MMQLTCKLQPAEKDQYAKCMIQNYSFTCFWTYTKQNIFSSFYVLHFVSSPQCNIKQI